MSFQSKPGGLWEKLNHISGKILEMWKYVEKYKKIVLAVPVAAAALLLAFVNLIQLPGLVDLGFSFVGEYISVRREIAVLVPLALTGVSILMVMVSKRTLTPWMVSVISLLLPIVLFISNAFSA